MPDGLSASTAPRRLLLVDDEANILSALRRLLRQDRYEIVTANSGDEALEVLKGSPVDVIITDQRMPGMTGVEFLRLAKDTYPDTVRIVLSGYTELQSVTDAVNEGAVYKFLTKPWDDEQLREHVAEAFRRKEMEDENNRLQHELKLANSALAATNQELDRLLKEQEQRIENDEVSLQITHEILEHLNIPLMGADEERNIVFLNSAAQQLLGSDKALLGTNLMRSIPLVAQAWGQGNLHMEIRDDLYGVNIYPMGKTSRSRGKLITFVRLPEEQGQ
ncbi:response regulator [Herbaspirillum sp.]|uniref:response regulator n=1 Tax=Herbaspirillum sp. TaxID=1890675 RepID=UPI0031CED615